jgi:hypothetical protein
MSRIRFIARKRLIAAKRSMIVAGGALLLAACADEPRTWPGGPAFQPDIAFCYVTLANVDCYANPQVAQEYRQVTRAIIAPH